MENQKSEVKEIFMEFASAFEHKIDNTFWIQLQYEITCENDIAIIQVKVENGCVQIYDGEIIEPENIYVMSIETLRKLYRHELTPLTALANEPNESGEMCSLIEPKYKDEAKKIYLSKKNDEKALEFASRVHKMDDFFNKDDFYMAKVQTDFCRRLHQVNAIGLYNNFAKGALHVYFSIKEGETLSEPPIEFSVYILQGKGTIVTGDDSIPVSENEYYHICPKQPVQIKNDCAEDLNLLYLGQM